MKTIFCALGSLGIVTISLVSEDLRILSRSTNSITIDLGSLAPNEIAGVEKIAVLSNRLDCEMVLTPRRDSTVQVPTTNGQGWFRRAKAHSPTEGKVRHLGKAFAPTESSPVTIFTSSVDYARVLESKLVWFSRNTNQPDPDFSREFVVQVVDGSRGSPAFSLGFTGCWETQEDLLLSFVDHFIGCGFVQQVVTPSFLVAIPITSKNIRAVREPGIVRFGCPPGR